jgi:iron complex transport system permease protein
LFGGGVEVDRVILWEIRLPRVLCAYAAGFALGLGGAAMQGLVRNPLAEPGVLGVSAGATLGATLTLYFGLASLSALFLPLAAIAGATAVTALLLLVATRVGSVVTLLLVGIGLSSFTGAVMALLLNFAPNPFTLADLVNWTLGSVAYRGLHDLALAGPFLIAGTLIILSQRRALMALTLGEEAAMGIGLDLRRAQAAIVLGTGLLAGASVAIAGAIGFVGIVAPHLVRPHVGHDPGRLLLPSGLLAGLAVALADILIRIVPTLTELKLGVVAALVGAPVFVLIAARRGRYA